ncbi:sensor histidine kinase [Phytomonospora endophytica]|uniref:histidine kinase n=1 Tax=Phytomonospora endophytica TaxID=714109 RepID=A0A841FUL6_9ACTN|nr:histidine kinase [Phytomonospora endophytica]MBB6039474.1 signal transduction histidine kinase [Phytomonospora endophytica]
MRALWKTRRERTFDLWFVGVLCAISVGLTFWAPHGYDLTGIGFWSATFLHIANIALVLWRRAYPIAVGVIVTLTTIGLAVSMYIAPGWLLDPARPDDVWVSLATPIAAYAVMMFSGRRLASWLVVGALFAVLARPWDSSGELVMAALLFTVLPATIGMRRRIQKRLIDSLAERAEQAEREQHLQGEAARAEERTRLAGEVHDVVSHRVVLMILHAEALRRAAPDANTREAAEALGETGRQALGEMRELVGLLRGEPTPEGQSPPGLDELPELAGESSAVGFPVTFVEDGERPATSPVIGRTVHRIVREALTNVRKHAPGAATTVRVGYEAERVRLSVRNSAASGRRSAGLAASGSGSGLLGLRQRAELVGGTLRAGPLPGGGFLVEAELPVYIASGEGG